MKVANNFGRVVEITIDKRVFKNADYTMQGTVFFDNDTLPNESEIKIWNLSSKTIRLFKRNSVVIINAGYSGDIGTILYGYISNVATVHEGVDKITTIHVLDSGDLSKWDIKEKAYAKGVKASYILKDLAKHISLPIAQFELTQDVKYQDGYTAKGKLLDIMKKVAGDAKTECYINKNKLYIRNLKRGADDLFSLSVSTGFIGSPESFEEEKRKGYKVKSQLQYRIKTASVIELKSKEFKGKLYVQSGKHKFSNTGDFMTEVEAIV